MARKENALATTELRVSTNPILRAYLEVLVRTGTYGKSATEAAERILGEEIRRLIADGKLTPKPNP
jgi:hypothetical protein